MAFRAAHGQCVEFARRHKRLRNVHGQETRHDFTRQQVLRIARRATVRHMQQEQLGLRFEQFHRHMVWRADAW